MTPWYEPVSAAWAIKLGILWGSWLVWPLLAWWVWSLVRSWRSRSRFARAVRVLLIALACVFIEMRFVEPALVTERVTSLELGFRARVAVISDYHIGLYKSPAFLERVVARLNAMELDAVLIAGDHLYEADRPVAQLLAPLKALRHKTLSVPGNHDEQKPGPPVQQALRDALLQHGVVPVEYTHVRLERFTVVGLGDRFARKDGLNPLATAPKDRPVIVLLHNPDSAMAMAPGSAALVVAGHTHGGQIRIPGLYQRMIPTRHAFDRGLHLFAPVPVFVTTGLGEIGLPMRLLNPPAIDVLEIR